MKKTGTIIIIVLLTAIVVIQLTKNKKTAASDVFVVDSTQPVQVNAEIIKRRSFVTDLMKTGVFEPNREVKISPDIQGRITQITAEPGDEVKKGEILFRIDETMLKLQLAAVLVQIKSAQTDVARYKVLAEADAVQGIQYEKALTQLDAAKAQEALLIEQISRTVVKAPFDGIVTARFTEEGAFASPGIPVLQISDISLLRFTFHAGEHELAAFKTGSIVPIRPTSLPDLTLDGKVILTGSKANGANGFPVQLELRNPAGHPVKAGMSGRTLFNENDTAKVIAVPSQAIRTSGVSYTVYKIENGRAVETTILIERWEGETALIRSGLSEGEIVITGGLINIQNGSRVQSTTKQ